jgi:hypothetical protein
MNPAKAKNSDQIESGHREVLLRVLLETFDVYVRASVGIAAEGGSAEAVAVEALMNYCLALPEADDLIVGFLRGDLGIFSRAEEMRALIDRDTHSLQLEPTDAPASGAATDRLGRQLELRRRAEESARVAEGKGARLASFIRDHPETHQQVAASSHEFLVRWIMLHLMNETEARERGRRVAQDFWRQFPTIRARLRVTGSAGEQQKAETPIANKPRSGIRL